MAQDTKNSVENETDFRQQAKEEAAQTWQRLRTEAAKIQEMNLKTILDIWPTVRNYEETDLKWGDEIEYILLHLDHEKRRATPSTKGGRVVQQLKKDGMEDVVDIQPEAYSYMVESAPSRPYESNLTQLPDIEKDMVERRKAIQDRLDPPTAVYTLSRFGMFGSRNQRPSPHRTTTEANKQDAESLVTDDSRYKSLFGTIEARRGKEIDNPVSDRSNNSATASSTSVSTSNNAFKQDNSVKVDHPIYGMGGCGLQITMGTKNLSQATYLHDQLCPLGPIMLALSAASPILKGVLIDIDSRWHHLSLAADDRPESESHLYPRWSTSPLYLEDRPDVQSLNHSAIPSTNSNDPHVATELNRAGMPSPLATYYAHILGRDPLIHPDVLPCDPTDNLTTRYTYLQAHMSTFWPHIRLKYPSPDNQLPWTLEFRSMEAQPTDQEVSAMVTFVWLCAQAILHHNLELRVPMDQVEENMERAQKIDAPIHGKFRWNVKNALPPPRQETEETLELTIDEIINGPSRTTQSTTSSSSSPSSNENRFPGLIHYINEYITSQTPSTIPAQVEKSIRHVSNLAAGKTPTPARWMREYILKHDEYGGDDRVSDQVYFDMLCEIKGRTLAE